MPLHTLSVIRSSQVQQEVGSFSTEAFLCQQSNLEQHEGVESPERRSQSLVLFPLDESVLYSAPMSIVI